MSSCWACMSQLEDQQKFCTECSHWQNWRHYLKFSTSVLSLLVALIAVAGVFLPIVWTTLTVKQLPVVEISGKHENDWSSFELDLDNLSETTTVFPSVFDCTPIYLVDRAELPPRFTYQSETSTVLRGDATISVRYVFLESYDIKVQNIEKLLPAQQMRCDSQPSSQPLYSAFIKLGSGVVSNSRLTASGTSY